MKELSKKDVEQVIGGIAGTGDQGGPPIERAKKSTDSEKLPPLVKTGG